eukprot:304594-Prymnesium_polylepis.1
MKSKQLGAIERTSTIHHVAHVDDEDSVEHAIDEEPTVGGRAARASTRRSAVDPVRAPGPSGSKTGRACGQGLCHGRCDESARAARGCAGAARGGATPHGGGSGRGRGAGARRRVEEADLKRDHDRRVQEGEARHHVPEAEER